MNINNTWKIKMPRTRVYNKFKIKVQCIVCKHTKVMSEKEIDVANEFGCAICEYCGNPMTIVQASA